MIRDFWALLFTRYVDWVLKLKKNNKNEIIPKISDQSIKSVVKTIADMDFSNSSKVKDSLKYNLVRRIHKPDSGELDDQHLDNVAGGLNRTYETPDEGKKDDG